jgi:hypothetical protein
MPRGLSSRFHRSLAILVVALSCLCASSAQMIIFKQDGDKTVMCVHSGLESFVNDCGVRSDWYSYVFVGSISAVTPIEKDEQELQIVPEEVFSGSPTTPLTVLTSQGQCLPKLAVGDRWLFFLRSEKDKPIVLDYYANDSRSVSNAQQQIDTLRRLQNIGEFAILRGHVMRGNFTNGKSLPRVRVIAQREFKDFQSAAIADANGHFEFQPLPAGMYDISVDFPGSSKPDDTKIAVSSGACRDLTLYRSPHAQISGHVHHSDGSPMQNVDVILIRADNTLYNTTQADASGAFNFNSLRPGKYVVGLNLPGAPAWKYAGCGGGCDVPPASMYFNGAMERSHAHIIMLGTDEKRHDIDFTAPA